MPLFEIKTPDSRYIRHEHASLDAARSALQPGYDVTGEVIGAHGDNHGGLVQPIGADARSILAMLLERDGDALGKWLREHGFRQDTSPSSEVVK